MGKWAFLQSNADKFAQIGQKWAEKAKKVPFSENASKIFCPLLVRETGQKPTFFGHFFKISSVQFFKAHIKPGKAHFQKLKSGREKYPNATHDRSSYQSILPDPQSQNLPIRTDRISYVAAYEIFHLLYQCSEVPQKQ